MKDGNGICIGPHRWGSKGFICLDCGVMSEACIAAELESAPAGNRLLTLEQFTWPDIASAQSILPMLRRAIDQTKSHIAPGTDPPFTTQLSAVDLLARLAYAYVCCKRAEPLTVAEGIYADLLRHPAFKPEYTPNYYLMLTDGDRMNAGLSSDAVIMKIVQALTIPGLKR